MIEDAEARRRAVERLAFSYDSLLHGAEWLLTVGENRPSGEWNAHIDSFLVHSRRVFDVLTRVERAQPDDILVSDLVESPPSFSLPTVAGLTDLINKRVMHVTQHSEPFNVDWPIGLLATEFDRAMNLLINRMEAEGLNEVDRLHQIKDGHGGFRKGMKK